MSLSKKEYQDVGELIKSYPMGVSQWRNYGIKYGYWDFFKTEVINEYLLEAENAVKLKQNVTKDL